MDSIGIKDPVLSRILIINAKDYALSVVNLTMPDACQIASVGDELIVLHSSTHGSEASTLTRLDAKTLEEKGIETVDIHLRSIRAHGDTLYAETEVDDRAYLIAYSIGTPIVKRKRIELDIELDQWSKYYISTLFCPATIEEGRSAVTGEGASSGSRTVTCKVK